MRKLSEIKGEDALDILADLIEPMAEFTEDDLFVKYVRSGNHIQAVRRAIKGHKRAVLTVMALLEGEDVKTYSPSILRLPAMLIELFNDPDLVALFQSAETETSSGSATENTEETEQG